MNMNNVNPYDEILPNLYLGGIKALDSSNFDMIVSLMKESQLSSNNITPKCKTFIRLPINDSSDDNELLLSLINEIHILEKIHESLLKGESVLVHCFAGMSRSATLIACYLIKYHNMNLANAIAYIQNKRPITFFGGIHFMKTLQQIYENSYKTSISNLKN